MKLRTYFLSLVICLMASARMLADNTPISSVPFNKDDLSSGQYRIPSLVRINSNTLIAFTDYREKGGDVGDKDGGHNSIIAKKSTDNGATWGDPITILDATKQSDNFKYGDAATVYDPDSNKILLMCCGGTVAYKNSTAKDPIRTYMATIDPDHLVTVTPTDITETIYGLFSSTGLIKLFPTSGEMCRSKYIKKGSNNRVYLALATNIDAKVIYTDDLGKTWQVLGDAKTQTMYHANNHTSDETKCVELPDASVWITSRYDGDGRSRGFNVFNYSDNTYTSGTWGPITSANCEASPTSTNGNFRMSASRTNGSLVIVPARRVADGANVYIALHSIPYGEWGTNGALNKKTYTDRKDLGINWKVLKDRNDFTTMNGQDASKDVNASHKLVSGWNNYQLNSDYSAYSTMSDNGTDGVDLLFEHTATSGNYSIAYQQLSLSTITGGKYTYASDLDPDAYMNVNVMPVSGNVYLIKARFTAADGTITEGYLHSNFIPITSNGKTTNGDAQLTASQPNATTAPDPTYYWTYSQDDAKSDPYFSSYNGDGYMGWGEGGKDYRTGDKASTVICTPYYDRLFSIKSFHHKAATIQNSKGVSGSDVDGYSMEYYHTSYKANRFLAVKKDGTELNWTLNTGKGQIGSENAWTTDLIFVKVKPSNTDNFGSFNAPTFSQTGYPITFARSEDNCDAYLNAVKKGTKGSFDFNYYATLRAPFALYVPTDVKVYKLTKVDPEASTLTLEEYTTLPTLNGKTIIPRETPVIMRYPGERLNGNTSKILYFDLAPGQPFDKPDAKTGTHPTTKLNGTLGREVYSADTYTSVENGDGTYVYYLLGKVNGYVALYRLGKNKKGEFAIAHNKAYFRFEKGANASKPSFFLNVDDGEPTGITTVGKTINAIEDGKVYDLNGRYMGTSLNGLARGIYIQNGRKIVK